MSLLARVLLRVFLIHPKDEPDNSDTVLPPLPLSSSILLQAGRSFMFPRSCCSSSPLLLSYLPRFTEGPCRSALGCLGFQPHTVIRREQKSQQLEGKKQQPARSMSWVSREKKGQHLTSVRESPACPGSFLRVSYPHSSVVGRAGRVKAIPACAQSSSGGLLHGNEDGTLGTSALTRRLSLSCPCTTCPFTARVVRRKRRLDAQSESSETKTDPPRNT